MKSTRFATLKVRAVRLACLSALAASGMVVAINAHAAQASADTTATVILPIAIAKTADLQFGTFAAVGGGPVTMSTANSRSSGGPVLSATSGGNAASFDVSGEPNTTYAITLPANDTVTLTGGAGAPMPVNSFVSDPPTTGTLSGLGAQTLKVGAILTVGVSQVAGAYAGSFNVTVDYN